MDLRYGPEHERFRTEVREFLAAEWRNGIKCGQLPA
jgi:hypothetical protein